MTPRAAARTAARATTAATTPRIAALALLLAAILLAGGMLAGPTPPAAATALAVSAIAIQSSAGTDTQYHTGEDIIIRVTFGAETITAHSSATITINVGGTSRTASAPDLPSGGTNTYVDFTYTVADDDADANGITVAAGALGGSYSHTDAHPTITFTQTVAASASHRVNVDVTDYDTDSDGLIEIKSLAQLNAIRWDLNGDGDPTAANAADYAAAFPGRSEAHGCPDTDDTGTDPGPCLGYELAANLDFDTDGDGATHTNGTGDDDDAYYTTTTGTGAGWNPIGGADETTHQTFTTTFEGNNHTISNLYINLDTNTTSTATFVGLFADIAGGGTVRNVGLVNPYVSNTRSGYALFTRTGALAGRNNSGSTVSGVAVAGGSVTGTKNGGSGNDANLVGCLIGYNGGTVTTSHASCAATATGSYFGGDLAGGLVGRSDSAIRDSYATGDISADRSAGGLVGAVLSNGASTTGSYATGVVSASGGGGQANAGGLVGTTVGSVTGSYATGAVSASGNDVWAGGLAGNVSSRPVTTSYATGAVSGSGTGTVHIGGLAGRLSASVSASATYATGAVSVSGGGTKLVGGLVGRLGESASVTASYATGATSGNNALVGSVGASVTVANSYWDSTVNPGVGSAGGGSGQTTANLQMPTEYGSGIYSTWNVGNNDPWHFGSSSQYPILKFGHDALSVARQIAQQTSPPPTPMDYDDDNDNLIDITTLSQLDAVRHDLNGDGRSATGDGAVSYAAAFPALTKGMGCPATCAGYELMEDLDFDTDGDGSHSSGTIDADDAATYFDVDDSDDSDGVTGWTPIGGHSSAASPYTAIFEGNGNTIDNLYISLSTSAATAGRYVGLFAGIGAANAPGAVRNVGLVNPYVANTRTAASGMTYVYTGALAGSNSAAGTINGAYVSGGSVAATQNTSTTFVSNNAGCLLGYNLGAVNDSYADACAASATGNATGIARDYAGGLAGQSEGATQRSYATGTVMADNYAGGLFGAMAGGGTATASYATGAATASVSGGRAGGLVGELSNANTAVIACFAKGAATANGGNADAGGLVGGAISGSAVRAAYATGAVVASGSGINNAGGLVGALDGSGTNVHVAYAIGAVDASGGSTNNEGGLVGNITNSATVTNSHWNITVNMFTAESNVSKTTAQLRMPTDYPGSTETTATFYRWNVDLDNADGDNSPISGGDDPWDFGASGDYPVLSYGGISLAAQDRTPVDYDADNDGLIDIDSLARLNAVRYDLDGNGVHSDTAYNAVFVNRDRSAAGLMGCPLADHDDDEMTPEQAHCTGYELVADLTFDTDASGGIAAGDDYWNSGAGWVPIGDGNADYSGVFEGNRRTIDYLLINISGGGATVPLRVGLFGQLGSAGVIRGVGLTNASVSRAAAPNGGIYAGALVGNNYGAVTASSAAGSVSAAAPSTASSNSYAGGLVGQNGTGGAINASWANVAVAVNAPMVRAGGLAGDSYGGKIVASHAMGAVTVTDSNGANAGGLVGRIQDNVLRTPDVLSVIDASYATGAVSGSGTGTRTLAGLVASSTNAARVTNSYYDNTAAGTTLTASAGGGEGKTTAELQSITGYDAGSIYENWNVDVDGVTGNDDPWHFGTASQYPTLKYGGFSPAAQGSSGTDYDTDSDGLIEITTLAQLDAIRLDLDGDGRPTTRILDYLSAFPLGDVGSDAEMGAAGRMGCAYDDDNDPATDPALACIGYELMNDLDFDTNDSGATHTAGVGDSGDDYYNGGVGWQPIGGHDANAQPYTAILDGNGNDIENLFINLDTSADTDGRFVGLFANISSAGAVRNLGLVNPYLKNMRSGDGRFIYYGALAGHSDGAVSRVSVRGGQVAGGQTNAGSNSNYVGCLLGRSQGGTVSDSYATCAATAAGGGRGVVGGLVGYNRGGAVLRSYAEGAVSSDYQAGGLVGFSGRSTGRISDSYATGAVAITGHGEAGGLVGFNNAGADIVDSYATGAVSSSGSGSGATNTNDAGGLVGEMTSPGSTLTGSYATGAVSTTGNYNAVGGLAGFVGDGATVTGSYATGAVTVAAAASSNNSLGGLVGRLTGATTGLGASYATGAVSGGGGGTNNLGGLVGLINRSNPQIRAAYTTGAVSASGTGTNRLGGLVGYADTSVSNYPRIAASYAAGAVSTTGSGSNTLGGLVGAVATTARPVFTNVYWDTEATGQATSADLAGGAAQTTDALQGLTDYTDIYSAWNIDADNADSDNNLATNVDDPWDFGADSEYPALIYGALAATAQGRTIVDYDDDNDGLIDITTLAQLDAVRYDLNGDGAPASHASRYRSAFPNRDGSAAGRMGCPLTDHDSNADTPDQATCTGYELRNDLDFDTDGDGSTHTGGAGDDGDDYNNGGAGWNPIGTTSTTASHTLTFSGTFRGNGHTIDNLFINRTLDSTHAVGLFGRTDAKGRIETLGLTNAFVGTNAGFIGILVGSHSGTIIGCYVTGKAQNRTSVIGGMVGLLNGHFATSGPSPGAIIASYSTAEVQLTVTTPAIRGILAGQSNAGSISYSYGAGRTYGTGTPGQLVGIVITAGGIPAPAITDSYWDRQTTGTTGGKTTVELQSPAGYTGIYQNWNRNLDDDTATGDAQGRDDPWDIRLGHYPVLKYGNFDVDKQRPLQATVGADVQVYSGQTVTVEGSGRALGGATLGATPYRWTVTDPDSLDPATLTLSGQDTARLTFTAPTGLTENQALVFRLTVTGTVGGRTATVFDEVTVNVVAVRPNQLLSLSLTDAEGDAVSLAPSFLSLRYDYGASVANQIASVTVTPRVLSGSTMTLNGQAVTSGAEVEVPLKYRGNQITIIVTPPEPEPSETMDGETADGETTDETAAETPCSVENNGEKPCTYTVTVNRAVPPRLAFVPRSLTIDEGGTGTYTVELDTRILTGAVTVAIASDNPAVTVSPTEVTLRPLDMAPRTITVTAASDADRNDETATLTHTANGAHYYDVIATVGVKVNDTTAPPPAPDPALSVSATALRLAEGGSAAYTVALATRPDDNVTVTIASDNADVTTSPETLSFTTANWSTAQRVTVSAASDGDTANDTATLTHTASGGGYNNAPAVSVAVSVTDDDAAGLAITPTVLNLIENGISAFIVSLTAQPSANVTVAIASDNPDVTVRPTALTFTPSNWDTPQAVLVITRADAGGGDELATLRMTAQGGGYAGQTGQVLASVDDTLAPLPVNADAPAGVSVYGPPGTAARATVSPPAADTPTVATGAGFGIGPAVAVSASDAPDDGLEICLPVSDDLRAEAGSALILTLLRYAAGAWTELPGARDLGDRVCAAGVTGQAAYATAYALRPGTVLDLAASVGADPGTIALSWTPPAAGTAQVAVVVNVADDTDYCLDTLPGLDASTYTCADRRAGQTYVALLIVLLPDGGYTLANIVRFDLPAAVGQ